MLLRFFGEQPLGPILIGFGLGHVRLGFNILQEFVIGVVDELLVGFGVGARFFKRNIPRLRIVGSDNGALALERGLLKEREILAGFIDAGRHQDGVAAIIWTAAA